MIKENREDVMPKSYFALQKLPDNFATCDIMH